MVFLPTFDAFGEVLSGNFVNIIANPGPDEKKFSVHKDILCSISQYFDKALNGDFLEARKKTVKLHNVNVESLQAILYWAYYRSMPKVDNASTSFSDCMVDLVRIWLLADRLLLPALQNQVMGELCTRLPFEYLDPDIIVEIYNNTVAGSMLRKLVSYQVAFTALREKPAYFSKCLDELKELAVQVLDSVSEITSKTRGARPKVSDVYVVSSFWVSEN